MEPFTLTTPDRPLPLVFDSPHSGRHYPADWPLAAPLDLLRQGEDAYVDDLLAGAPAHGITVLAATFPRCYIDPNRDEDDIDETLLDVPWPQPVRRTDKTAMGLGLLRRDVVPGVPVHSRKLSVAEVEARIDRMYRPYHAALAGTLDRLRDRFGFVWHVDWHSMKSVGNAMTPDGAVRRPDFVIGDLDGTSAERALVDIAFATLRALGYAPTINDPYKGAAITRRYGRPDRQQHTIQIEINRALYLDEIAVAPGPDFATIRHAVDTVSKRLAEAVSSRLGS